MHLKPPRFYYCGSTNPSNVSATELGFVRWWLNFSRVENPHGAPCEAMLIFSNQDFLPVTFNLQPITCLGYQQAEIVVPMEAPNGIVTIIWCEQINFYMTHNLILRTGNAPATAFRVVQRPLLKGVWRISRSWGRNRWAALYVSYRPPLLQPFRR